MGCGCGQEALDKCLAIEGAMTREFLELMHLQRQSAVTPMPVDAVHPPRRTHSQSWPLESLETHHLEV